MLAAGLAVAGERQIDLRRAGKLVAMAGVQEGQSVQVHRVAGRQAQG